MNIHTRLIVIGGGPGGYTSAIHAAKAGAEVTLVERGDLGGTCLNRGCIPLKSLLTAARAYESANNAAAFGVVADALRFDFPRCARRVRRIVDMNRRGVEMLLKKHGVTLLRGEASFTSPTSVTVTDAEERASRHDADAFIIATGSTPVIPPGIDLSPGSLVTCQEAVVQQCLPESAVIIGGGTMGCEMASLYNALGVKVAIVEKMPELMSTFDHDLSASIRDAFRQRGINVYTDTSVFDSGIYTDNSEVWVTLSGGERLKPECCILATGCAPAVRGLNLDAAGVSMWKDSFDGIQVDASMQTTVPHLYAVGDVTGMRLLAHVATAQATVAADHCLGKEPARLRYDAIPEICWTLPPLVSAGLTENNARSQALDIAVSRFPFKYLGASHAFGLDEGYVKVIAEKTGGEIRGIHIFGEGAAELAGEASVIVANNLTVDDIERTVHAHPSMGEVLREGILSVAERNIHGL